MRILEGVASKLQLSALLVNLSLIMMKSKGTVLRLSLAE